MPTHSPQRGRKNPKPVRSPNRGKQAGQQPATARDDESSADARGERLQKILAAAGIASRRECEELISEGRVEVDGEVVTEQGVRVDRHLQEVRVDGEPLPKPKLIYFAVHKPTGVVSTARDPSGRPRVIDLLPPGTPRVYNVGRLDLHSEGLILVTNDGELANRLTHPRHGVHKTYHVQVAGHPKPDVLRQLHRGMHLAEGFAHIEHVRIKSRRKQSTILEMVLDEGRNREIRRLLARAGHKVERLTRVAVGPIRLGDLPRGAVRRLTTEEVRGLRAATKGAGGRRPTGGGQAASRTRGGSRPTDQKPGTVLGGRRSGKGNRQRRTRGGQRH